MLPHLKAVLERRFWNGLQLARRITLNRLDVVKPLSFERHVQFWEHAKVAGSYVGTVRRLAELYNLVFRQKLLHKKNCCKWMRWRVIVVKKPITAWPETRSFSSYGITQSFRNCNVIFFVDRLTSWSKFVVHNTLTIENNNLNAGRILFGHTSYDVECPLVQCEQARGHQICSSHLLSLAINIVTVHEEKKTWYYLRNFLVLYHRSCGGIIPRKFWYYTLNSCHYPTALLVG